MIVHRTLGRTGLKVSTLGFGCFITSDPSVVRRAAELGVNYFDTARDYQRGNNERMLGAALKGLRKGVYISTKSSAGRGAEALAQLDTSLRELGTDYVDIWFLHAKDHAEDLTRDLMEAQRAAVKAGKVRFKGVSTHFSSMLPHVVKTGHFDVAMVTYNFGSPPEAAGRIAAAAAAGVGVIAMKVMGGANRSIKHLFRREQATSAALKWALKDPGIACAVPSMTDFDQLDENLRSAGSAFTDADRKLLAVSGCRSCGACEGACERGLPVAAVLRSLMYAESYGQFPVGRESFLQATNGVRCAGCRACTVRCPNGVRVAQRMARAEELFA